MRKLLFFLSFVLTKTIVTGQVNSISGSTNRLNNVVQYRVIRDAPDYANNLLAMLYIPYFQYNASPRSLGIAAEINYCLKNTLALNFMIKKGLKEFPLRTPEPDLYDITPDGNKSKMLNLDLNLDYSFAKHFSDKKKLLWGGWINFKQMFRFGIRAGYQYYATPYNAQNYVFKGYNTSDPKKTEKDLNQGNFNQMMSYSHIVSLGFSAKRTSNFVIQIENKDRENSYRMLDFAYMDILFAPAIKFGDVTRIDSLTYRPNTPIIYTYHITSGKLVKWGFRAGYMYYPLSIAGFCYGAEIGLMPGPSSDTFNNGYILAKIGVAFSANIYNRP